MAVETQLDLLVSSSPDAQTDTYGLVCVAHNGLRPDDLKTRMATYKVNSRITNDPADIQFAHAAEPSPQTGTQYLFFNTFQPSLAPGDAQNPVSNWIQISQPAPSEGSRESYGGTLKLYDMQGVERLSLRAEIPAGGRKDFAAHNVGDSVVGLVVWTPDNPSIEFELRNIRYVFDNPQGLLSFKSAFQLPSMQGSSETLYVPLDSRTGSSIIEVANASADSETDFEVQIFDEGGMLLRTVSEPRLKPYGSHHILAHETLAGGRGAAVIKGANLLAVAMQYERSLDGGLEYMYGLPAKPASLNPAKGAYNLFIGQESEIWIVNRSSRELNLSIVRSDGSPRLLGAEINLENSGLSVLSVGDHEEIDNYGTVTVQGDGGFVAWILRKRPQEYAMPIEVK